MCEVNFENYIAFPINTTFDPGFMGAFQFLVKAKPVFSQELCNLFVTPVVQSPRHDLEDMLLRPAHKDFEVCL
jgi:hypothetical protein